MVDWTETGSFLEGEESSHELNEVELIKLAQKGDQHAFALLWNGHHSKIMQYLNPIVGCENAEDVAQETFIKAWKGLPSLRILILFTPWLRGIAKNCAYDYLRRQKKHRLQIPLDTQNVSEDIEALSIPGPEEGVEQRELIELALSQIKPIYRYALILYVYKGLSEQDIAEQLKIKETSVGSYIRRGREMLLKNYNQLLAGQGSKPSKRRKGMADE